MWCLITCTLIVSSRSFIKQFCLSFIRKISLSNWNHHINIASVFNLIIYIIYYVRRNCLPNALSNIPFSSLLWLILTIFNISSVYCVHCFRFLINEPMHLIYFLYFHQIEYLWIILYMTASLRDVLYSTFNYYYRLLIMMSQLKVMNFPRKNVLYQQHNFECRTVSSVHTYFAVDCILCLVYYK